MCVSVCAIHLPTCVCVRERVCASECACECECGCGCERERECIAVKEAQGHVHDEMVEYVEALARRESGVCLCVCLFVRVCVVICVCVCVLEREYSDVGSTARWQRRFDVVLIWGGYD